MQNRGRVHFAILFVVNPLVILFYQNCSVLPVHSKVTHQIIQQSARQPSQRTIASVEVLEPQKCRFVSPTVCTE